MDQYFGGAVPLPAPRPDGLDAGFWALARDHVVSVQRCDDCGRAQFPPEIVCLSCRSSNVGWKAVPPEGTLHAYTRVWHPVHPGLAAEVPYLVAIVELEPGARMVGNLLGDRLTEFPLGTHVEPVFEDHDAEDVTLIHWRVPQREAPGPASQPRGQGPT